MPDNLQPQQLRIDGRDISVSTGIFINNAFRKSSAGRKFPVLNLSTGKELLSIEEGVAEDVDDAVKAARQALQGDTWSKGAPSYRGELLGKLADLLELHQEDIIALEMANTGKIRRQMAAVDFPTCIGLLRYYAGWTDKILGSANFNIPNVFAYTRKEPIGVCALITPWNYPLAMLIAKLAPAIAAGNTVVVKSAETTPLTTLKVCQLIVEAGFPPGVVNHVAGFGKTVGQALSSHMGIDKVSFTGSTATGQSILKASASSNLKKVTLELGGKSPVIVFDDADVAKAARWSAWGINFNFGQACVAGTRIYVHEDVYEEFLDQFTKRLASVKIGDNFDPNVDQGPVSNRLQYDKILSYIDIGKREGATVHFGGKAVKVDGKDGLFIQPTIFTNTTPNMTIVKEEIFGPVVTISKFSSEADVLNEANDTIYGLASAVFTQSYERSIRVTNALKAGTSWVNLYHLLHWTMPFGGFKQSGMGREFGEAGLEPFIETKSVFYNMGDMEPPE